MTINYQLLGNDPMLAEMGQTVPLNYILKKVTVDSKTTTYWVPKNNENRECMSRRTKWNEKEDSP